MFLAALVFAVLTMAALAYFNLASRYYNQTHTTLWSLIYMDLAFAGGPKKFGMVSWGREMGYGPADITICLSDDTKLYLPEIKESDILELAKRVHGDDFSSDAHRDISHPSRIFYEFGQYDLFVFVEGKLESMMLTCHGMGPFSGAKIARGKSEKYITLPATREEIEALFGKPIRTGSSSMYTP